MNAQGSYYRLPNLTHRRVFALGIVLAVLVSVAAVTPALMQNAAPTLGPLRSERDAPALLQYSSGASVLGFQPGKVILGGMDHALTIEFVNGSGAVPVGRAAGSSKSGGAPALGQVMYAGAWPGVDVFYTPAPGGVVESSYVLQPGSDVGSIRLSYNVPVEVMVDGSLQFSFESGTMQERAPVAWQVIAGERVPVAVNFAIYGDGEVGFALGEYQTHYALMIDPFYSWHAFFGAGTEDIAYGLAAFGSSIYMVGYGDATWSWAGATPPLNAYQGGADIEIVKLNSLGAYQWHTFYGSAGGGDYASEVALDASENLYVVGYSTLTWNGPGATVPLHPFSGSGGPVDTVVLKLNSSGTYQWHTFFGSGAASVGSDYGTAIAVSGGDVYAAGYSLATWDAGIIPPLNAFAGHTDLFVLKLNNLGTYQWHTFYGSASQDDYPVGVDVDGSGNVYVAGQSNATWNGPGPTAPLHAYGGFAEMTVLKLNSAGTYQWHTFYGAATGYDYANGLDVSGSNVYVVGYSDLTWDGPGPTAPLNAFAGNSDLVVLKLDTAGTYGWHTFYGSSTNSDVANGVVVAGNGNIYVTGYSFDSWNGPGAQPPSNPFAGTGDIVIVKLTSGGAYGWHTFYGSAGGFDSGNDAALDGSGALYVAGESDATWDGPDNAGPLENYTGGADMVIVQTTETRTSLFVSQGANDGWVLESTETSGLGGSKDSAATTLRVGDEVADKQYRGIVSFNTAALPDNAVITKVTLKVKKQGLTGTNPFTTHGTLMAAIRKPYFGAAVTLANADFQAAQSKQVGFSSVPVSNWYSTNNNSAIWPYINLTGTTQFRLRFTLDDNDDLGADYVRFYSGNAGVAYRPQLIVTYYVP